jgi:hypothetical protein
MSAGDLVKALKPSTVQNIVTEWKKSQEKLPSDKQEPEFRLKEKIEYRAVASEIGKLEKTFNTDISIAPVRVREGLPGSYLEITIPKAKFKKALEKLNESE